MTKYFRFASVVVAGLLTQGCSDDASRRTGTGVGTVSKYDVEHPEWKMHPGALIVQREDIDFVYDVEVQENKLVVPTAGHEAFIKQIVAGKTVLVSRANEDNALKNGGFVRRILALRTEGSNTVFDTERMRVSDLVRGRLDSGITKPWGVKKTVGAAPQAGGLALKKRFEVGEDGKRYYPTAYDKVLDVDLSKELVHTKGEAEVSFIEPSTQTLVKAKKTWLADINASVMVKGSVHVAPFLEFYLDINADVDWGWTGPSIDIDINRAKAAMGVEYEAKGELAITLAGTLKGAKEIDAFSEELNLFPGCNIGGIPCGVSIETKLTCESDIGGSIDYRTTTPAKVYGTPRVGGEYYDGDFHTLGGDLFAYQAPVFNGLATPPSGANNVFPAGVTRVTMKAYGKAECRFEPRATFYIGEAFGWWIFTAEARAGVYAALSPIVRAAVAGCVERDLPGNGWLNPKWGFAAQGFLQPEVGVFLNATLGGHGFEEDRTLDLGGEINIFTLKKGDFDPLASLDCPAPTP